MAHGDAAMGGNMLNTVVMESNKTNAAPQGAMAGGGPRIVRAEVDNVRSYMYDKMETKETLHIDRFGGFAKDIARVIEKLAEMTTATKKKVWIWVGGEEELTLKLTEHWKVKITRDGAVVVNVTDNVLIADDAFILLEMDRDGYYVPIAKGREITWDGTEEYITPSELRRLVKDVVKQILEQMRWL
jgi:Txe/YoeB family toxin of Txe-Axe toxin-antitoxin module